MSVEFFFDREQKFVCPSCLRGTKMIENQSECYKQQVTAAEKMKMYSEVIFLPLDVGDAVVVSVPEMDRRPSDWPNVRGIILEIKNSLYRIGTEADVIKDWLPRKMITISNDYKSRKKMYS